MAALLCVKGMKYGRGQQLPVGNADDATGGGEMTAFLDTMESHGHLGRVRGC